MSEIVVLMGSPRKDGNTDLLVSAFADGAKQHNNVEIIRVCEKKINGCTGCNFCHNNPQHKCSQNDDMAEVYEKVTKAEIIVIATPVYFYGVSSQLKALIDRFHNPIRNNFKVQKLLLLSVCADTIPTVFDSVKAMYYSVIKYFSLEDAGVVTAFGVEKKGDIKEKHALKEAYELGMSL